jgi:hypothetical protein
MLSSSEAKLWLNPDSSETMLEGIVGVRTQASRREARGIGRKITSVLSADAVAGNSVMRLR